MREDVATDLRWSARAFVDVVWPTIGPLIGGGELIPVEAVTSHNFLTKLDQVAGIDGWIIQRHRVDHMFGIASRVQNANSHLYETFTVRTKRPSGAKTEYEKRREQISTKGSIWPLWTSQAYVNRDENRLVQAAIARTEDIIAAVTMGLGERRRSYSGEEFQAVGWRDLWTVGSKIVVVINGQTHQQGDWGVPL